MLPLLPPLLRGVGWTRNVYEFLHQIPRTENVDVTLIFLACSLVS